MDIRTVFENFDIATKFSNTPRTQSEWDATLDAKKLAIPRYKISDAKLYRGLRLVVNSGM